MTVTQCSGEQHVFHLLQERLAHQVSLIPFLLDAISFSSACNIWTSSDVRVQPVYHTYHVLCLPSHNLSLPPLSSLLLYVRLYLSHFFASFSLSLTHFSLSSCSSNSCTCLEEMRRSMHCCYATTSSTVGGGPGWCLDMPFLKVTTSVSTSVL